MWSLPLILVALIIVYVTHWLYRWTHPKCSGILPPGSSGFPLIGETLQMVKSINALGIPPFMKARMEKYGPLFRTNVVGRHIIVSADAEINHVLLGQQYSGFLEHWYLDSFGKLFGQDKSAPDSNTINKYVRGVALHHFGVDSLKEKLIPLFEGWVRGALLSWSSQDSIKVKTATATTFLRFGLTLLFSSDSKESQEFVEMYLNFSKSFMSVPLNIPGTTYHKAMKDKERVLEILRVIIREKLASGKNSQDDLLDQILADMNKAKFLTEDFIAQLMFSFIFVTFESTAWTAALIVKFISESPSVLQELKEEHDEILKKKENLESSITWEDYKSMTYTHQVINETLRLGTSSPGFLRKATRDFEINGYTIPAGWGMLLAIAPVHFNPKVYEDPLEFNPRRWKDIPRHVANKHLTPFGGGMRPCAGADYARVLLSIFLHVLVTEYRWMEVRGGEIIQNPMIRFKNDLCIRVTKIQK